MLDKRLSTAGIESAYELIANGIDQAGDRNAQLFLAKLSLALANLNGDLAELERAIEASLRDL